MDGYEGDDATEQPPLGGGVFEAFQEVPMAYVHSVEDAYGEDGVSLGWL